MKFGISILAVALFLGGCADAFDASTLTEAHQANVLAHDKCDASGFKTYVAVLDCDLAGDLTFVKAIKLRDMSIYYNYARQMSVLAVEIDARQIPVADFKPRAGILENNFTQALTKAYAQTAADNADMTNFLVGVPGAFATGYVQGQAIQANHAPVMTTCTTTGTMTNCLSN